MKSEYYNLKQFLTCYFNQNFMIYYNSMDESVLAFIDDNDDTENLKLIDDINHILSQNMIDCELREKIFNLGSAYDPTLDGYTMYEWLSYVVERVKNVTKSLTKN